MITKNLILIRHAKSSWENFVQDVERPLTQRGIKDITLVAEESKKILPAALTIFSSPAKRAQDTALIFESTIFHHSDNIFFNADLYTFEADKLEKCIKSINNDYDNVILFGHNDAITNFVNKFGTIFIPNVPTSGLVWLQFETDNWEKLKKGITIKVMFPKNLK